MRISLFTIWAEMSYLDGRNMGNYNQMQEIVMRKALVLGILIVALAVSAQGEGD